MNEPKPQPRDIMSETPKLIETLKARAAYMVAGVMTSERDANDALLMTLAAEALTQAQARCAEVEKDAARYRFIRKIGVGTYIAANYYGERLDEETDAAIGAAIDAALKE